MKKFMMIAACASMLCSCTKENVVENTNSPQEGTVYISIKSDDGTKATGSNHGTQSYDNTIKTLEVFIFRINDGQADDGMLDSYRKFTETELKTLSRLEVKATTGKKMIYVVANSHKENWGGGMTREVFEQHTADLFDENVMDFVMIGGQEETLQLASTITVTLKRLVSRIKLNSVTAAFAGTPYEGAELKNVKAYLINVQAEKLLYNGTGRDLKLINSKKYNASDIAGSTMEGMLYEELSESIGATAHSTAHYFYCYENALSEETETDRFTRLVIEAQLSGTTYYYPIAIKNLERNCSYSVDVKIQKPGSLDPDQDVVLGALNVQLNIAGWSTSGNSTVEF